MNFHSSCTDGSYEQGTLPTEPTTPESQKNRFQRGTDTDSATIMLNRAEILAYLGLNSKVLSLSEPLRRHWVLGSVMVELRCWLIPRLGIDVTTYKPTGGGVSGPAPMSDGLGAFRSR